MIRIIGIGNKKKIILKEMDRKLAAVIFPQARWENLDLPQMCCCFGQPFCYCQVLDKVFIMFILSQMNANSKIHGMPY